MAHELTHVVQQGAAKRINSQSVTGLSSLTSASKVRAYLQALVNGAGHDPSVYAKGITQFQKENTADHIASLQHQILEKPEGTDILQRSDSEVLRRCSSSASSSATPTNFRQTAGADAGGGVLHFEYAWESSTGNLADLSDVEVGERVDYTQTENPPFSPAPNPTIIWIPGQDGGFQDNHSPGTVKPYKNSTERATQYYRYRRSGGSAVNLMGPISIIRRVTRKPDGNYRYRITKSGLSADIDPLP
jgi:hypothetical protein